MTGKRCTVGLYTLVRGYNWHKILSWYLFGEPVVDPSKIYQLYIAVVYTNTQLNLLMVHQLNTTLSPQEMHEGAD